MRRVFTRVLHLTAPGAALALLGLAGATAPAAAGVAGTAARPATVYVANQGSGTVTPIRVATNQAGRAIKVAGADDLLVTPDGKTLYAVGITGAITPVRVATNMPGKTIQTGADPFDPHSIAITPNGRILYLLNFLGGTVIPVRTATNRAGRPIRVGLGPVAIAITPEGRTAYVANFGNGQGAGTHRDPHPDRHPPGRPGDQGRP